MAGLFGGRRRPQPPAPEPVLQTMSLPNGRFILVLSGVGDAEASDAVLAQLPELTGAAAVLVWPDPLTVLSDYPPVPAAVAVGDQGFLRAVLDEDSR